MLAAAVRVATPGPRALQTADLYEMRGPPGQIAGVGAAKLGGYALRLRGLNPLLTAVSTRHVRRCWSAPGCAAEPGTRHAAPSPLWPGRSPSAGTRATGLLIARMD